MRKPESVKWMTVFDSPDTVGDGEHKSEIAARDVAADCVLSGEADAVWVCKVVAVIKKSDATTTIEVAKP